MRLAKDDLEQPFICVTVSTCRHSVDVVAAEMTGALGGLKVYLIHWEGGGLKFTCYCKKSNDQFNYHFNLVKVLYCFNWPHILTYWNPFWIYNNGCTFSSCLLLFNRSSRSCIYITNYPFQSLEFILLYLLQVVLRFIFYIPEMFLLVAWLLKWK